MAINIFCPACKRNCGLKAKVCKCGNVFGRSKQYRVTVYQYRRPVYDKVLPNLTIARKTEEIEKAKVHKGEEGINEKRKPAPKLAEVWAKYLPWAKEHKKTWDDDFLNYRKHLAPRFDKKRLDAISPLDVERLKLDMKKAVSKRGRPYTPATIKHQLVLLNRLYNLARKWGLYHGPNPLDQVPMPKLDNQVVEFLNAEQLTALWRTLEAWPDKMSAAFIRFNLLTGVRRSEQFRLTWEDVNFDQSMITLRKPKGGKTVTIDISPQALEVLENLPRTSPYVFPGKGGQQRTDFKGPWRRIRRAAGLPESFRFHGLRHNFACYLASKGVAPQVIQRLMTHKDYRTTQKYAHLQPGVVKEAAALSGELLIPGAGEAKAGPIKLVGIKE